MVGASHNELLETIMNANCWRKAGTAAALSLALAAPSEAFLFFGPETVTVEPAVEYYNAKYNEYFVTTSADEIAVLNSGATPGWVRTKGVAFFTIDKPAAVFVEDFLQSALPVCRYYIPPASHFISLVPDECAGLREGVIDTAIFESDAAFYAWSPDALGRCPMVTAEVLVTEFTAVYRLWEGKGSAHRFTTSKAERDAMVADGWVSEGYGNDGVAMCVPPSGS
jgi:hypothetical protein